MELEDWGTAHYPKSIPATGQTVGSAFPAATKYFEPSKREFMFNLIVDDLEETPGQLKAGGAEIIGEIEKFEYGLFGWFVDPNRNKVEL
jgi:predicted enzyme related to lactoylglutathione lyase